MTSFESGRLVWTSCINGLCFAKLLGSHSKPIAGRMNENCQQCRGHVDWELTGQRVQRTTHFFLLPGQEESMGLNSSNIYLANLF